MVFEHLSCACRKNALRNRPLRKANKLTDTVGDMPASHFAKGNGAADKTVVRGSEKGGDTLQGDRSRQARFLILVLAVLLVAVALFSLTAGASQASSWSVLKSLFSSQIDPNDIAAQRDHIIIFDIRLPRIVLGILIGASLAVSGAVMQGLFRNPLADPGLVGVSSGASLGAVTVIVLGGTFLAPVLSVFGMYTLPLAAFFGGLAIYADPVSCCNTPGSHLHRHNAVGGYCAGGYVRRFQWCAGLYR